MDSFFRKIKKGAAELQKAQRRIERASGPARSTPLRRSGRDEKAASTGGPAMDHERLDVNLGISQLPPDVEGFLKLRDQFSDTPAGAAAIFLLAMHMYGDESELGLRCLTIAVDTTLLEANSAGIGYKEKVLLQKERDRFAKVLKESPETARGYWKGAGPDNGYTPETPLQATLYRQLSDGETASQYTRATRGTAQPEQRLFVMSEGYQNVKESGRPILLARNTSGVWKAKGYAGVVWPVMKETVADDGDDL